MFYLNPNQPLTPALLSKIINRFVTEELPRLEKYGRYYQGKQKIEQKSYSDTSKPCNKTVTNYCRNISDMFCGYIASPGYITYDSEHDIAPIMEVLRYNDYQAEDQTFLQDALVYGVAAELMYIDSDAKTRFRTINPTNCFGIFDDALTNDLLYFVRFYQENEWDNSDMMCIDVYTEHEIYHYRAHGLMGALELDYVEPHYFAQCPANIFYMPDEKSVFDCVLSLQDAYNEILTSEIDDYSAFVDAYLTLTGVDADAEDVRRMKENRVLVLPEGARAEWLTKRASDSQTENILKRIHDSIYRTAQVPDFSNDVFNSAQSGIAIRFKLTNMETRACKIVAEMKKALQRRIEVIAGIASLTLTEAVWRDVEISFRRNIPVDNSEIGVLVNALKGIVSDTTLLSLIPQVQNPIEEARKVEEQKQAEFSLYSIFHSEEG